MLKVSDLLTLEELPGITLVAGHKKSGPNRFLKSQYFRKS